LISDIFQLGWFEKENTAMQEGILNRALVHRAWEFVGPCIELTMKLKVTSGEDLAVVVTATHDINPWSPSNGPFSESCYLVASLGIPSRSAYPIHKIALSKAELSARTGLPTSQVPPQYRRAGDTLWWGSAVLGGIVAACSGVDSHHDEMFAWWIAAAVQAEAKAEYDRLVAAGGNFLNETLGL
jgi:hypothetical protein